MRSASTEASGPPSTRGASQRETAARARRVQQQVELGGRAEMEPREIPVCVFCVLSDPAGAVFVLTLPVADPAND